MSAIAVQPLRLFRNRIRVHWYLADFILFMMIIGPLIAPYFQQSSDPARQAVAQFIFWIGKIVCPQLEYSFTYDGMLYAVCYRCVAAVLGLTLARVLHRPGISLNRRLNMREWSARSRLIFLALTVSWLTIDVQFIHYGIWTANIPLVIVHGILYGMSVGGVCYGGLLYLDRRFDQWQTQRSSATQKNESLCPSPPY